MTWLSMSTPIVFEQRLGAGTGGDPRRGLARAGALEHVAGVGEAVLLHAGKIGVTRTRLGERLLRRALGRRHLLFPLRPLGVADLDGDGRAERATVANTAEQRDLVLLEAHPRAAAVAETAATEFGLHVFDGDLETRRQTFDDDNEAFAMRLAGGQVAQHGHEVTGAAPISEIL